MAELGRAALVTGAAAGIGASFAEMLAREGYDVVLVDRQADRVNKHARALAERFGVKTHAVAQELTHPDAVENVWTECQALGWHVDVLVNNAGTHHNTVFHKLPWSAIDENIDVLVTVVLGMTHRFLPGMVERGWGRIINVASISGLMPGGRRLAIYSAAKAFVVRFSEALGFELENTGVEVLVLCPGFTRTDLFVSCGLTDVRDTIPSFLWLTPERVADEGLRASMKGVPLLVNGAFYRFALNVARVLPRRLVRERSRILHKAAYRSSPSGAAPASADSRRRTALVTGASSGIGASFAESLARAGFDVILVARRGHLLEQRAGDLTRRFGVRAYCIVQDLSDPSGPELVRERCDALGLAVDVLVNSAGNPFTELFHEASWTTIRDALEVHVRALVHLTHLFLPDMIRRSDGRIINIASVAAFEPGSYRSSMYASAKAFALNFSESLGSELEGTGVSVSVVCPGFTRTEWTTKNRIDNSTIPDFLWLDSDRVADEGLDAAMHGAPFRIVGGVAYQLLAAVLQIAPRRWLGRQLSRKRKRAAI